jgi:hypothetical protein
MGVESGSGAPGTAAAAAGETAAQSSTIVQAMVPPAARNVSNGAFVGAMLATALTLPTTTAADVALDRTAMAAPVPASVSMPGPTYSLIGLQGYSDALIKGGAAPDTYNALMRYAIAGQNIDTYARNLTTSGVTGQTYTDLMNIISKSENERATSDPDYGAGILSTINAFSPTLGSAGALGATAGSAQEFDTLHATVRAAADTIRNGDITVGFGSNIFSPSQPAANAVIPVSGARSFVADAQGGIVEYGNNVGSAGLSDGQSRSSAGSNQPNNSTGNAAGASTANGGARNVPSNSGGNASGASAANGGAHNTGSGGVSQNVGSSTGVPLTGYGSYFSM